MSIQKLTKAEILKILLNERKEHKKVLKEFKNLEIAYKRLAEEHTRVKKHLQQEQDHVRKMKLFESGFLDQVADSFSKEFVDLQTKNRRLQSQVNYLMEQRKELTYEPTD